MKWCLIPHAKYSFRSRYSSHHSIFHEGFIHFSKTGLSTGLLRWCIALMSYFTSVSFWFIKLLKALVLIWMLSCDLTVGWIYCLLCCGLLLQIVQLKEDATSQTSWSKIFELKYLKVTIKTFITNIFSLSDEPHHPKEPNISGERSQQWWLNQTTDITI